MQAHVRYFVLIASLFIISGCTNTQNVIIKEESDTFQFSEQHKNIGVENKSKLNDVDVRSGDQIKNTVGNIDISYANRYTKAVIHTNLGDINVELYGEIVPLAVSNFLQLSEKEFYNGTKFHRVIKDFMVQSGDPNSKDSLWSDDGTGGPGYVFPDEKNEKQLIRGSLAMANAGPNTNGSQFFIVTKEAVPWLDGKHTHFGKVIGGMDVVDKIENARVNENDHPIEDIFIKDIRLIK